MKGKPSRRVKLRLRRKKRIRNKINGTAERPRLTITRSAKHLYAQIIDDDLGVTLASVGSFKSKTERANADRCAELGKQLASQCKDKKIEALVFDKNGYTYHGRVKAFADAVREGGLNF